MAGKKKRVTHALTLSTPSHNRMTERKTKTCHVSKPRNNSSLRAAPCVMQDEFCIAIRRLLAFKHKFQSGLEGDVAVQIARHWSVGLIPRVLLVHKLSHLCKGVSDVVLSDKTVEQPI